MDETSLSVLDYFLWGALSGAVGYAYYVFVTRKGDNTQNHVYRSNPRGFALLTTGILLSSLLGGLFAVAFDHSRAVSIMTGVFTFFVYTSILRGVKSGHFMIAVRDLLVRILTGGKV